MKIKFLAATLAVGVTWVAFAQTNKNYGLTIFKAAKPGIKYCKSDSASSPMGDCDMAVFVVSKGQDGCFAQIEYESFKVDTGKDITWTIIHKDKPDDFSYEFLDDGVSFPPKLPDAVPLPREHFNRYTTATAPGVSWWKSTYKATLPSGLGYIPMVLRYDKNHPRDVILCGSSDPKIINTGN